MRQVGALFGGEPSGHLIFKRFSTTGDGIQAALKTLECIRHYDKPLAELADSVNLVPQQLINVKVGHKKPFSELAQVQKVLTQVEKDLAGNGRVFCAIQERRTSHESWSEGFDSKLVDANCQKLAQAVKDALRRMIRFVYMIGLYQWKKARKKGSNMKTRLGVNIDHVATLRQQRDESYPSVAQAARIALDAGADQITIHLREDRRHIQDADVPQVKAVTDEYNKPLNLEIGANESIVDIALEIKPAWLCLVPEKRQERTTEEDLI